MIQVQQLKSVIEVNAFLRLISEENFVDLKLSNHFYYVIFKTECEN
jgi:hypothetical protein